MFIIISKLDLSSKLNSACDFITWIVVRISYKCQFRNFSRYSGADGYKYCLTRDLVRLETVKKDAETPKQIPQAKTPLSKTPSKNSTVPGDRCWRFF